MGVCLSGDGRFGEEWGALEKIRFVVAIGFLGSWDRFVSLFNKGVFFL